MNRHLDRIAATVLLIFVPLILFLPIAVTRYFQFQIVEAEVAPEIQAEIQDLQDTTEDLQETVDQIQAQVDDREVSEELEVIDQALADMSEQIEQIGDDLSARPIEETVTHDEIASLPSDDPPGETLALQDELLTLIGWTVGLLSVVTAAAWASVVILRSKRRRRSAPISKDMW